MQNLIDQTYNTTLISESLSDQKQPITSTSSSHPTIASTLTTTEGARETDLPSITTSTSKSTSTFETATMFTTQLNTAFAIETNRARTTETGATTNIPEPEVHTALCLNSLSVSTDETATLQTTLVDIPIPPLETTSTAAIISDVITTNEVHPNDTNVFDTTAKPIVTQDSGHMRSTDVNIAFVISALSYAYLLWRRYWNKIHLRSFRCLTDRRSSDEFLLTVHRWRHELTKKFTRARRYVDLFTITFYPTPPLSARERNTNSISRVLQSIRRSLRGQMLSMTDQRSSKKIILLSDKPQHLTGFEIHLQLPDSSVVRRWTCSLSVWRFSG